MAHIPDGVLSNPVLAAGALAVLVWLFAFSERRIERMWASLALVFFAAGAIFIFNGGLF